MVKRAGDHAAVVAVDDRPLAPNDPAQDRVFPFGEVRNPRIDPEAQPDVSDGAGPAGTEDRTTTTPARRPFNPLGREHDLDLDLSVAAAIPSRNWWPWLLILRQHPFPGRDVPHQTPWLPSARPEIRRTSGPLALVDLGY
jgi:hypothetical protein